MPEFPTPDPITVRITLPGGVADVYAEERDTASVQVEPYDGSPAAAEAAAQTRVDMMGDTLVVAYPHPSRLRGQVRVRVRVPAGSTLRTDVASADVNCHGTFTSVTAKSASGAISVEEVSGDLAVNTSSGDVRAGRVGGQLRVDSASSDVRVGAVGGDARADSASGDVEIGELGGGLVAKTASGDCRIGVARQGSIRVDSASGDVTIGVAAGTLAWLDLSSLSGTTHSDLAMSDGAAPDTAGEATLSVQVRTMSGDIHIRREP